MISESHRTIRLTLPDPEEEAEFCTTNDRRKRVFNRVGILLSVVGWFMAGLGSYGADAEGTASSIGLIVILLVPVFIACVLVTYVDRLLRFCQPMAAIANITAGGVTLLIAWGVGVDPVTFTAGLVILVFFAHFILRVRFRLALPASLTYILGAHVLVLWGPGVQGVPTVTVLAAVWSGVIAGTLGGYYLERAERRTFLQQKLIETQRAQIQHEQERSEALLLNVLPQSIADRLKRGDSMIADRHESVTVLFADIVGFTEASSDLPAEDVVGRLNRLFSRFDDLVARYHVEKIKTIGDAYMVASGVPEPSERHGQTVASFALAMLEHLEIFNRENGLAVQMRVGIHSGPIVAGVIGTKKFVYDLWGDTVNTASRMESNGVPGRIQLTEQARAAIGPAFTYEDRGVVDVKGKGPVQAYFLADVHPQTSESATPFL